MYTKKLSWRIGGKFLKSFSYGTYGLKSNFHLGAQKLFIMIWLESQNILNLKVMNLIMASYITYFVKFKIQVTIQY